MRSWMKISAVLFLSAGVALTSWAANNEAEDDDDENEVVVAIEALPAAVRAAVQAAAPGEILEAELETEKGVQVYEVEVKTAAGIVEVTVTPDGKVIEIESEDAEDDDEGEDEDEGSMDVNSLPAAVKSAALAVAPSGKIVEAEMEGDLYEVAVKSADGTVVEVTITADGSVVEIEEEISEAELPAAVQKTLSQLLPGGKMHEIEKKMVVVYEIEKTIDGMEYNIKLDQNGRVLSIRTGEDD